MTEKSMLSTLQQAAANLLEASQEAGPPISVGPAPGNRKAREKQMEYIDGKSARLQEHVDKLEAQIAEQHLAADADLVQTRVKQAALDEEIGKTRVQLGKAQHKPMYATDQITTLKERIQVLEMDKKDAQETIDEVEAALNVHKKDLAQSFEEEKTIYSKREPQIAYLQKQLDKYKRRLGGHKMRTAHLKAG